MDEITHLRWLIERKHWTLGQTADRLGVHTQRLLAWLNRSWEPSTPHMEKIKALLEENT